MLFRTLATAGGLVLVGCRVSSLPPAASRTDGGPVSARGIITHEAKSQVRLYRDAAGCRSVQTENRQFRVATVQTETGPRTLVLEEAYDQRYCLDRGSQSSEAMISAWDPDTTADQPLYRIRALGSSGGAQGNLYRVSTNGCCGSRPLTTFYSLLTGNPLFSSSGPVLLLNVRPGGRPWYVAFHDSFSAASPTPGNDPRVVGVLQESSDQALVARLVVRATAPEPFALDILHWSLGSRSLADTATAGATDLAVTAVLVGQTTQRRVTLRIPLRDGRLAIPSQLPPGFDASFDR
jgi:hypothetical protein